MANQSLSLDLNTARTVLVEIKALEKSLSKLKRRVVLALPAKYGSKTWWEKEEYLADEEIARGEYKTYKSANDLIKDLHKGI